MKERPAVIENTGRNTLGTQILTNKHLNSRQTTITLHNNSKHWHIKIKQKIHQVDFPESSKLCFSRHFYSAAGILSLKVDTNTGIPFSFFLSFLNGHHVRYMHIYFFEWFANNSLCFIRNSVFYSILSKALEWLTIKGKTSEMIPVVEFLTAVYLKRTWWPNWKVLKFWKFNG